MTARPLICQACSDDTPVGPRDWRCPRCGAPLELPDPPSLDPAALVASVGSVGLWRYLPWLPVQAPLSLGEPVTPLHEVEIRGVQAVLKLESSNPTGSFKDRGSAVLVAWLREAGVRTLIEDSSGNAGASVASYAGAAGLEATIFVPEAASAAKLVQVRASGARVVTVPGPRSAATDAAVATATGEAFYASHLWSPLFLAGTATFAWELWEQLGRPPDAIVLPLGGGTLLLGVYRGFEQLRRAGLIDRLPRLYGIQSSACPPLATAMAPGAAEIVATTAEGSAAEGILLAAPPRGRQVLDAIRATRGTAIAVDDETLWQALFDLARRGVYVEPTSAIAFAGLVQVRAQGHIEASEQTVVAITGSGLKAGDRIGARLG
jgi:threonine synthase